MSANTPERLTPYRTPSNPERPPGQKPGAGNLFAPAIQISPTPLRPLPAPPLCSPGCVTSRVARHELRLDLTTAAGQRQDAPDRRFATHASKNEHPLPRWFRSLPTRSPLPSIPGVGRFTPPFPLWWALEPARSGVVFLNERSDEPPHWHPVAPCHDPLCFHTEDRRPEPRSSRPSPT